MPFGYVFIANETIEISNETIGIIVNSKKYGKKIVEIDREDYKRVKMFRWVFAGGYITSNTLGRIKTSGSIQIHRLIMSFPLNLDIDHIDRDKLNNKKNNLRACTAFENMRNRKKCSTLLTSKYKGVCKRKGAGKFIASICANGKRKTIGIFSSENEAAAAYNKKALELHGQFACINNFALDDASDHP